MEKLFYLLNPESLFCMAFQLLLQSLVLLHEQLHLLGDLPASRGRAA